MKDKILNLIEKYQKVTFTELLFLFGLEIALKCLVII